MTIAPELIAQQLQDRRHRFIRADGSIEIVERPIRTNREIERLIGAQSSDCVQLRHLGHPVVMMIVDDLGYEVKEITGESISPEAKAMGEQIAQQVGISDATIIERKAVKARKPVNEIATALYHANCRPGTTHQIVGDVYICLDEDFA
jgi:hypothetical protein